MSGHRRSGLNRRVVPVTGQRAPGWVLRGTSQAHLARLLHELAGRAARGTTVIRVRGTPSERNVAFAGLRRVCAPLLTRIGDLPQAQRDVLQHVIGPLANNPAPNSVHLGLAVLTLLTPRTAGDAVLVLVENAEQVDDASLDVLAFVARTVLAEPITIAFTVREPAGAFPLLDLPQIQTDSDTGPTSVGQLLEPLFARTEAIANARPWASEPLHRDDTRPACPCLNRVWEHYALRWETLPSAARMLVLLASADPAATPAVLRRAAAVLDLPWDLGPAESAGLVLPNSELRFVHPLAASAVYTRASPGHRRTAHAALSRASDPAQADHRTWHAACAAPGPDEEIAAALEESAERARRRGDPGGAARLLTHAAAMTPDSSRRGTRALAAAEGHLSTNALDEAAGLIAVATTCRLENTEQARLARLRARALLALRSAPEAGALLLVHAAEQLAAVEVAPSSAMASAVQSAARQTYLEALSATALAGHVQGSGGAHAVAASARHHVVGRPVTPTDLLLDGLSTLFTDFPHHGVVAVRRALAPFAAETPRGDDATTQWLMLAPLAQQTFIHHLWDFPAWARLSSRATRLARVVGDLSILPVELMCSAGAHLHCGNVATAAALVAEADSISAATGTAPYTDAALIVAAWRGEEDHVLRLVDEGRDGGMLHGELSLRGVMGYASGVLYNGLSRYDLAMEATRDGFEHDEFNFTGWSLAEHIEAAARVGDRAAATGSLHQLAEHTRPADTAWAHGIQARCEALVAAGHQAEEKFQQARYDLSQAGIEIQVARTHLLYGEWLLQRPGRSIDAEDELRTAHRQFTAMHADAFAARAGRALTSSGLAVPSYNSGLVVTLTPQELQIAQRAARSLTSQAIAAELFLSVQTVEFHLQQAFAKLNVHDLLQLREIVPTSDDPRE